MLASLPPWAGQPRTNCPGKQLAARDVDAANRSGQSELGGVFPALCVLSSHAEVPVEGKNHSSLGGKE